MTVGIIANPASGKDIRRLVAQGSVFDNSEKANILRRILRAIDALGGRRVLLMPDSSGIGSRALDQLKLGFEPEVLDLPVRGDARDSTAAAGRMVELGARCIVVLGGDGTNRAVARACGDVPLLPISTGTNNVFSSVVEGTVAGLTAQIIVEGRVDLERVTHRAKRLEVLIDGQPADLALVDVASTDDLFVGSRAIWEPARLREAVLSQALPGNVGISSVGGCIDPVGRCDPCALWLRFGPGGRRVLAPLAPGLVVPIEVAAHQRLEPGQLVHFAPGNYTLALDGEREIEVGERQRVIARLGLDGPRVVDLPAFLAEATRLGAFER